jgi:hypothetical protein
VGETGEFGIRRLRSGNNVGCHDTRGDVDRLSSESG